MDIEEQIRAIAKEELETLLDRIEKQLHRDFDKENEVVKSQLEEIKTVIEDLSSRIKKIEDDSSNRWGLLVKLRKYTLDQMLSEYKRLTGTLHPEHEESTEKAEI